MISMLSINKITPTILIGLIAVVYLLGVAPDMTWMGLAGDAPDYVASSMLFQTAGLGGYPLYITTGWIFEQIFHYNLGFNPYWALGLVSAISTVVTSGYIYATIRLYSTKSLLPAILGTLAFAGSLLVWSQSVIPEVYGMTVTFMVVGTYYLLRAYKQGKPRLLYVSAFVFGLSFCTHPLAYFAILPCLIYVIRVPLSNKPHLVKLVGMGLLGLIPWMQFFVAGENVSYPGISSDKLMWLLGSFGYLGNLPIVPNGALITRLQDFLPMLGLGSCILIPSLVLGFKETYRTEKFPVILILTILLLPLLLYVTSRPPQWITYLLPAIAFLSILGGICAVKFLEKYQVKESLVIASVCGLGLLGLNLYSYDIGRSIDPSPTTARQMYDKFSKLPPGSIIYAHSWGHIGLLADTYNRFTDGNTDKLIRIDGTANNDFRQRAVAGTGVLVPINETAFYNLPVEEVGEAIAKDLDLIESMNPDRMVYVTYVKDRRTIQFDYISSSNYRHSLNDVPQLREAASR